MTVFGGGSVIVCAEIHHGRRTAFVHNYSRRTDGHQISRRGPAASHVEDGMFQHDNTRPHVARVDTEGSAAPQRPDITFTGLNPAEHLWDRLDQLVRRKNLPSQTLPQVLTALQHEWQNTSQRGVQRLVASMRSSCHRGSWSSQPIHFVYPDVAHMPVYMVQVDSQRCCFEHVEINPFMMVSWSLVVCVTYKQRQQNHIPIHIQLVDQNIKGIDLLAAAFY